MPKLIRNFQNVLLNDIDKFLRSNSVEISLLIIKILVTKSINFDIFYVYCLL